METVKLESNGIERWAEQAEIMFKSSSRKITKDKAEIYAWALFNEEALELNSEIKKALEKNKFEVPFSCVFWNRIRLCHTYTVSVALAIFMGFVAESFGDVTIYVNYLQYQAFKHDQKHLNMDFISKLFPKGPPSRETMQYVWEAQKLHTSDYGSDNMLDHSECQDSIAFKD